MFFLLSSYFVVFLSLVLFFFLWCCFSFFGVVFLSLVLFFFLWCCLSFFGVVFLSLVCFFFLMNSFLLSFYHFFFSYAAIIADVMIKLFLFLLLIYFF